MRDVAGGCSGASNACWSGKYSRGIKAGVGEATTSQRCSPRGVVGESCLSCAPSGFSTLSRPCQKVHRGVWDWCEPHCWGRESSGCGEWSVSHSRGCREEQPGKGVVVFPAEHTGAAWPLPARRGCSSSLLVQHHRAIIRLQFSVGSSELPSASSSPADARICWHWWGQGSLVSSVAVGGGRVPPAPGHMES